MDILEVGIDAPKQGHKRSRPLYTYVSHMMSLVCKLQNGL